MKYFKHVSFLFVLALGTQLPLVAMKRPGDELEGHDAKRIELDDQPVSARTRSHFSRFDEIPVELMQVIFEYLELQDLLQLNQTCKTLQPFAQTAIDAVSRVGYSCDLVVRLCKHVREGSHFMEAIKIVRHAKNEGYLAQELCLALAENGREFELAINSARWGMRCEYYYANREWSMKIYKVLAQQGQAVEEASDAAQQVKAETGDGCVVNAANRVLQVPQVYALNSISWYDDWYHPKRIKR